VAPDHGFPSGSLGAQTGPGRAGSPSQQPSLSLQRGHCQVPCTQRISTPHRQHASELTRAI
jgi:hypothetical protein